MILAIIFYLWSAILDTKGLEDLEDKTLIAVLFLGWLWSAICSLFLDMALITLIFKLAK